MCRVSDVRQSRRPAGFTLIELLVVLTLIILVAALGVAFVPKASERQSTSRAADRLQGWLLVAKQWAKRDSVPTGIRLVPDANGYVRDMQYVQKPGDFGGGAIWTPGMTPPFMTIQASGVDFTGGITDPNLYYLYPVQPGDYLEVQGGGPIQLIDPAPPLSVTATTLRILPGLPLQVPAPSSGISQYRIIRGPRVLQGEPTLSLPQGVAIDTFKNGIYGNALPGPAPSMSNPAGGPYDILFEPSGNIAGGFDKFILWVRDTNLDDTAPGDQTLVTIYCRTGLIAAHPVDPTPDPNPMPPTHVYLDPYAFTRDGRSSGL